MNTIENNIVNAWVDIVTGVLMWIGAIVLTEAYHASRLIWVFAALFASPYIKIGVRDLKYWRRKNDRY